MNSALSDSKNIEEKVWETYLAEILMATRVGASGFYGALLGKMLSDR